MTGTAPGARHRAPGPPDHGGGTRVAGAALLRHNREFRLLWVGGLASGVAAQVSAVALPLVVLASTGSAAQAGLAGTVSVASTLLSTLPGGAIADAVERRNAMLVAGAGAALASVVLAATIATGPLSLPLIFSLVAAGSALVSVHGPAAAALLVDVQPADQLAAAAAYTQSRTAAARLAGPLLSGLLYGVAPALPFVVQAAAQLLALGCVLALRGRSVPRPADTGRPLAERLFDRQRFTAGLLFVWREPRLRIPLLVFGLVLNAAFGAAMLVAVAETARVDASGRLTGLMSAMAGAGSLLGGLLAARLPVQRRVRAVILLTCCGVSSTLLLLAVTPPLLLGVVFGGCTLVAAVGNVAFVTILLRHTPGELLGRAQGAASAVSMVTQPAGPFLGGYLFERHGGPVTFTVLGLLCLGCCLAAATTRGCVASTRSTRRPRAGTANPPSRTRRTSRGGEHMKKTPFASRAPSR